MNKNLPRFCLRNYYVDGGAGSIDGSLYGSSVVVVMTGSIGAPEVKLEAIIITTKKIKKSPRMTNTVFLLTLIPYCSRNFIRNHDSFRGSCFSISGSFVSG